MSDQSRSSATTSAEPGWAADVGSGEAAAAKPELTSADPQPTPADPAPMASDHTVLYWLVAAAFVVILNETIMVTAIPRLMVDLSIDASAAQWLSTVFMLTMGVVIPLTGWLLQRLTTRAAFTTAMATFCIGTLLAALAPGFAVLLLARVIQAGGTAIMMPLLMTTLMQVVHERDRGRVMGSVSLAISVAPALGPALSGVILHSLSWRWIFVLVLPIAAAIAAIGLRRLRNVGETIDGRVDWASVAISVLGFGGLVFGLSEVGAPATRGVGAWSLAVGLLGVGVFTWRQLRLSRTDSALLDVRVLTIRVYAVSMAAMAIGFMALMGAIIVLQLYLQQARMIEPLVAGLVVMPGGLAMGLLGPWVGRMFDRHGARVVMIPGAIGLVGSCVGLVLLRLDTPLGVVVGLHVVLSLSLSFLFTPLFTMGLGAVPARLYSHASSVLGTTQQVAGAMGTAVFVTVLAAFGGGMAGIQGAFAVGAVLTLVVLALVLTLPARVSAPDDAPGATG